MTCKIGILYQNHFGGTDLLLGKLSNWVSMNEDIVLIDIEQAKKNKVLLDFIILPTSEISSVFYHLLQGLKFKDYIIWCMGHGAFRAAFINERVIEESRLIRAVFSIIIPAIDFFLQVLLKNKRVIFTDYVGLSHDIGNFGHYDQYQHLVFPIVVERSCLVHKKGNSLRFGWVGRVDHDFKVGPLIELLQGLNQLHLSDVIFIDRFYILGDGNAIKLIKNEIKTLSFRIELLGSIPYEVLSDEIDDKIDILFAMGTSVLEGAKLKLPSIIVNPFSLGSSEQSGYRWIYDSIGYSLGEFSLDDVYPIQKKVRLDIIINELVKFGYDYHANKSYEYSESFYPESVFSLLYKLINGKRSKISLLEWLLFLSSFVFVKAKKLMKKLKKKDLNHD